MSTTPDAPQPRAERVSHALVRDVSLPGGAGTLALVTIDNGLDHTKPTTLGPLGIAELTTALTTVRERVLVSQSVALAIRAHLESTAPLETDDGRSTSPRFVDLLDISDFTAGRRYVEVRSVAGAQQPALYVPTMPLMVGVLSDFYVAAQVDPDLIDDFADCDGNIPEIGERTGLWINVSGNQETTTLVFGVPGGAWGDQSCGAFLTGICTSCPAAGIGVTLGSPTYDLSAYDGIRVTYESESGVYVNVKTYDGNNTNLENRQNREQRHVKDAVDRCLADERRAGEHEHHDWRTKIKPNLHEQRHYVLPRCEFAGSPRCLQCSD